MLCSKVWLEQLGNDGALQGRFGGSASHSPPLTTRVMLQGLFHLSTSLFLFLKYAQKEIALSCSRVWQVRMKSAVLEGGGIVAGG